MRLSLGRSSIGAFTVCSKARGLSIRNAQTIRDARRQCHDGHLRIDADRRRKEARVGHVATRKIPELTVQVDDGLPDYLKWVIESVDEPA